MDATTNIATDLFYKIRSRFSGLKLGEETGQITINPEDARFFDFDYTEGDKRIGHVSISLAEPNSMKVYFSNGISEGMDDEQKNNWYGFLRELRKFAKRRLLAFDTRDIAKDNLDKRDYAFLSQYSTPKQTNDTITKPVGESVMNESNLYGTKTQSFQKLEDTRLIIKHSKTLADDHEQKPGDRSRNISALFVENQHGERFKYPFIHLAGARAMQRHVANGGLPYDEIGESIIKMSEEIAQLKSFTNYCVRNDLMNSDTNSIVERSQAQLEVLRDNVAKLSRQAHYEAYKESFQTQEPIEVPDDVMEQYKEAFTVKNFKEDIASAFPIIYRLMKEQETIGYDDIVEMTGKEEEEVAQEETAAQDPMAKFEAWVDSLGEESPLTIADDEEKTDMIKKLNELVGQHFPAGVDGTNAIQSLKGIIEDPKLEQDIKKSAQQDPDQCVRPLIKAWVEENAPEVLDQLDFGDMVDEPAVGADEVEPQQEEGQEEKDNQGFSDKEIKMAFGVLNDPRYKGGNYSGAVKVINSIAPGLADHPSVKKALQRTNEGSSDKTNIKELAEFINSFYDKETGTFPKGPEGVCTMVGKKFGEQAEQVARKFVERMAPAQERGAEAIEELERIKSLSGITV
jgi:hypothetical protein